MNVPNGSLFGIYRALVVNAADPEKQGRVRVHIPDLMVDGDSGWTGQWCDNGIWARPANNWIGGRNTYDTKGPRCNHQDAWYQGSCMIPPKGSHVFLFFEKGDPSHPFYFAAADYGQTKVLPENRWGPKWWMKWTPIKTREGRTIVISDDTADARVEITGKKRHIKNTPDGDTESVFNIDGNQSVFLIDERPSHEKIFLKDYRGNYIKMIQDEEGINDQLHVYFKDDIHLETLKNIYIQAGENIHITAKKNIYITALQNMYIDVIQEFREMANLINRYSKTNDNRTANIDINDNALNTCARSAANIVRDMAGVMASRASGGSISDGAGGALSIQSGGVTSILGGGGTMIDGAFVTIENGSAPIPPSAGITTASMSIKATPPKPDPDRHFEPSDDGWCPTAPDENPQYKCHNKFWKPHYNWSGVSQCDSATVTIGGGGGGGGGGTSNAIPPSNSNSNSNNTPSNSSSSSNSNPPSKPQDKKPASINKAISKVLDDNKTEVSKTPNQILQSSKDLADQAKDAIVNTTLNTADKIKDGVEAVKDEVEKESKESIKNQTMDLLSASTNESANTIVEDIAKSDIIDMDGVRTLIEKIKKEVYDKVDPSMDFKTIRETVHNILMSYRPELIDYMSGKVTMSVTEHVNVIDEIVQENFDDYKDEKMDSLQNNKEKYVEQSNKKINDIVDKSIKDNT